MSKVQVNKKQGSGVTSGIAAFIPLLGFVLFGLIPLVLALAVSFTELHSSNLSEMKFVGLDNYVKILTNGDKRTYASYLTTVIYMLNAPICIALSLYIANLMNKIKYCQRFFRSVLFIPYVCSTVVVGLTFKILYKEEGGALNGILTSLGFRRVGWMAESPTTFLVALIIMTVWAGLGFCIILYQAALANVDQAYYEAAVIDGASPTYIFWKITMPAVSPTTGYLITMKLIWALQGMTESYILSSNTNFQLTWPNSDAWVSDTVVKHIYNMVFNNIMSYGFGLAAAAGVVLAVIVFIVTRINMKIQDRLVNYDF